MGNVLDGRQGANFTNGYRPKAFTAPPSSCNNNARLNVSNDGNILVCATTELLFWLPSELEKALHQSDKHIFKCTYVCVRVVGIVLLLASTKTRLRCRQTYQDVMAHDSLQWRYPLSLVQQKQQRSVGKRRSVFPQLSVCCPAHSALRGFYMKLQNH